MKTENAEVNPNPKPFDKWIFRTSNTYGWLFSEQGHTGYWEFAWIKSFKLDGTKKTMDEVKEEAKEIYELFYGKNSSKKK